jgi:hypothetical protein
MITSTKVDNRSHKAQTRNSPGFHPVVTPWLCDLELRTALRLTMIDPNYLYTSFGPGLLLAI